jgi:exodeoxyribonuclease VII large subunit
VSRLAGRLSFAPQARVRDARAALGAAARRATLAATGVTERRRLRLQGLGGTLNVLSPLATLERGYTIVSRDGLVTPRAATLSPGDDVTIRFADGEAAARIADVALMREDEGDGHV